MRQENAELRPPTNENQIEPVGRKTRGKEGSFSVGRGKSIHSLNFKRSIRCWGE